jgi:hypothetical protein
MVSKNNADEQREMGRLPVETEGSKREAMKLQREQNSCGTAAVLAKQLGARIAGCTGFRICDLQDV